MGAAAGKTFPEHPAPVHCAWHNRPAEAYRMWRLRETNNHHYGSQSVEIFYACGAGHAGNRCLFSRRALIDAGGIGF
jgi:hypothetical protein